EVQQIGPCCHTNKESCFHNPVLPDTETYPDAAILNKIYATIEERLRSGGQESYVKSLVNEGGSAILRKVGEEATEVILAAKDRPDAIAAETTDLVFHLMILLASRRIPLGEIFKELAERHTAKTS
ncbi:phosphoribosyl-ATP diphosphatase, partial [Candidatus Bathyarchaeota archaeon]|nr:phosphoribosyl-ATP diphosphatase [Candidatus Bathyarchaeota archaeon]